VCEELIGRALSADCAVRQGGVCIASISLYRKASGSYSDAMAFPFSIIGNIPLQNGTFRGDLRAAVIERLADKLWALSDDVDVEIDSVSSRSSFLNWAFVGLQFLPFSREPFFPLNAFDRAKFEIVQFENGVELKYDLSLRFFMLRQAIAGLAFGIFVSFSFNILSPILSIIAALMLVLMLGYAYYHFGMRYVLLRTFRMK
jgi:hypothetical protein